MKNRLKKFGSLMLAAALLLGTLPMAAVPAYADDVTEWDNPNSLPAEAGSYKLMTDVTINSNWTIKADIILDLNGHGILMTGNACIYITKLNEVGYSLTLNDSNPNTTHYITLTEGRGTSVSDTRPESGAEGADYLEVRGGYITGCNGVAVTVDKGCFFTLNAGSIVGNTRGGVLVQGGTFTMEGGEISYNTSTIQEFGGGVEVGTYLGAYGGTDATFTMKGGKISHNTAPNGGGVRVSNKSTFIMKGGKISDNTAENGGGVAIQNGNFNMEGGEISNNTAGQNGGGVLAYTNVTLSGGIISNNTAGGWGGGVYDAGGIYRKNYGTAQGYEKIKLSGNIVIKNNRGNGTTNNLHLSKIVDFIDGVDIINELTCSDGSIGVTLKTRDSQVTTEGAITASANTSYNNKDKFFSDANCTITKNVSNQLYIDAVPLGKPLSWTNPTEADLVVKADSSQISSGDTVPQDTAITVASSDSGYAVTGITATSGTITDAAPGANGTYTFTMPNEEVAFTATLAQAKTVTVNKQNCTVNVTQGGMAVGSGGSALVGETVTVSADPASGYILGTMTVTETESGNPVETVGAAGTLSFTMPAENVVITANAVNAAGAKAVTELMEVPALDSNTPTTTYTYTINTKVNGAAADVGNITIDGNTIAGNGSGTYTYITTNGSLTNATVAGSEVSLTALSGTESVTDVNFTNVSVTVTGYKPQSIALSGTNAPALTLASENDTAKEYTYISDYAVTGESGSYNILIDGAVTGKSVANGGSQTVAYHTVIVNVASNLTVESATLKSSAIAIPMEKTVVNAGVTTFKLTRLEDSEAIYTVCVNGEETGVVTSFNADNTVDVTHNRYTYTVTVKKDGIAADVGIVPEIDGTPMLSAGTGIFELVTETGGAKAVTMAGETAIDSLSPDAGGEINYYTLTYAKAESETGDLPSGSICLAGANAALAASTLVNGDKVFGGWDIGGTVYQPGAEVIITAATTATATWSSKRIDETDASGNFATVLMTPTELTYNGEEQTPEIKVYYGSTELTKDTHYTLSFSGDKTNVGTVNVTVVGTGDYAGEVSGGSYTITKKAVQITGITAANRGYNGSNVVALNTAGAAINGNVDGSNLTVSNLPSTGTCDSASPGSGYSVHIDAAGVTLSGSKAGNYVLAGIAGTTVTIGPGDINELEIAEIASVTYAGIACTPAAIVRDKVTHTPLDMSEFDVSYSNNINAGTATVTVTGRDGGNFSGAGSIQRNFTIAPAPLTVKADNKTMVYGYSTSMPALTYTVTGLVNGETAESVISGEIATTQTVTPTSGIGEYTIGNGTLAASANYALIFETGTLTIRKAAQDVPAAGEGYTIADGKITIKSDANANAHNETHYEVWDGTATYPHGTDVTISEDKNYRIRWAGSTHYEPSGWTMVLAAQTPAAITGSITVGVNDDNTGRSVSVSIEAGNDAIDTKQGVTNCELTFDSLSDGFYNVVVRTDDGDYTETRMIEIKNGSAETTVFELPVGKLATVVEVKTADTPKVAVEGLGEILTAEDKNAAAAGAQDIEVKLEAAKKAEGEAEGASAIKAIVESGKQVAVYIDLSLYKTTKTLDDKGAVTATDTIDIGATNNKVLEIAIPFNDAKTKEVKVYRYHGGAAAELAALADKPAGSFTDGTYYVDKDNGYIFLYASEFSTYAITTPKTGGNRKPTAATTEGAIGVNPAPDDGACKKDRTCPIWPFSDASPAAWYHDGVHWALDEGVMRGYSAALFGPNDATTRAQVAQMLYNIEGKPAVGTATSPFVDVRNGDWYAEAVIWAAESGVVLGFERDGADVFDPDAAVTREQFAAMMQRYAKLKGADVSVGADLNIERFSDAGSVSLWATDAMRWAVEEKLITGRTEETLVPLGTATRAEIATILMRYFRGAAL